MRLRRGGETTARCLDRPVRVLRVISRLNVGGPSIQVITLAKRLEARGYETALVRGTEGPEEGHMHHLAEEQGVVPIHVPSLTREIGFHDVRALVALVRIIRRFRPDVIHTHAAKAGMIGRLAALLSGSSRPAVAVHTFHGHVFDGVFTSKWKPRVFVRIERLLARITTRFVAVSEEVREDLIEYGIADRDRISVVHLGFELDRFVLSPDQAEQARAEIRSSLGIPESSPLVTVVARVVQMKRIDRFLRVAERLQSIPDIRFLVVGDGEDRRRLEESETARQLGTTLVWAGMRHDIPRICAASDVVVLTSDNEGTPVALIEAQACAKPVVGTRVGGVATVIRDGETGFIVDRDDEEGLAGRVRTLLATPVLAGNMGAAGREHVFREFTLDRLVDDIDELYRELLPVCALGPDERPLASAGATGR